MRFCRSYSLALLSAFLLIQSAPLAQATSGSKCTNSTANKAPVRLTDGELQLAEAAQVQFFSSMKPLMELFYLGFPQSSKLGTWMARAKEPDSMAIKLLKMKKTERKKQPGFRFTSFEQITDRISDGLGGRLIIDRPNRAAMRTFVDELIKAMKNRQIEVLKIENYWGQVNGTPYLTRKQLDRIKRVAHNLKQTIPDTLTGKAAQRNSGYTSLHLDLRLPNGTKVELQVRGRVMQQLAEVSHLFYDFISGKPASKAVLASPTWSRALRLIERMSSTERSAYSAYLAQAYSFVRTYITTGDAVPPKFPLKNSFNELQILHLARSHDYLRLADLIESPQNYRSDRVDYQMFGSARLLSSGLDTIFRDPLAFDDVSFNHALRYKQGLGSAALKDVIGNVAQGSSRLIRWDDIREQFFKVHKMLGDLKFTAVIAWEEHHILEKRRSVLRSGKKWSAPVELPGEFDASQKLGRAELYVGEIHFMQDSGNNATGKYTVINNAHGMRLEMDRPGHKDGVNPRNTDIFPPIQVWRDTTGKVWTLDHRRLISLNLAEWKGTIPVEFVDRSAVEKDRFKFTNASGGRSIILHLDELQGFEGESPMAIVVRKMSNPRSNP